MCLQIRLFLLTNPFLPTLVAHSEIEVISSKKKLITRCNYVHIRVKASVDNRLGAAGANGFYLSDRVGKLKEPSAARKEMTEEVGTESKAQYRDIAIVNNSSQVVDVAFGKELALVGNNYVTVGVLLGENAEDIIICIHGIAGSTKSNT